MSSRNFQFALAASPGVKILPDLSSDTPELNEVVSVAAIDPDGNVHLEFSSSPLAGGGAEITVADAPPALTNGALWFCSTDTQLYVGYVDPTGPGQWVVANNTGMSGSYLPLTGGTVTGLLTLNAGLNSTAGPTTFYNANGAGRSYNWAQNVFGTAPAGQQANWGMYDISTDTVDASPAFGGGAYGMFFGHNISSGAVGGRTGVMSFMVQQAPTNLANNQFYVSGASFAQAAYSAGGTSGAPQGNIFARNESVQLLPGATNWNIITGSEITIGVRAGASVAYKGGLSVVQWASDAVQGSLEDFGVGIGTQSGGTSPGWKVGIQFGMRTGWWPFRSASTLIGTGPGVSGGPAMNADWGIDLAAVTFGSGLIRGPGFSVDGSGVLTASGGTMNGGLHFGASIASGPTDLSRHVELYSGGYAGFSVTSGSLNHVSGGSHVFFCAGAQAGYISSFGLNSMPVGQQNPAAGTFSIVQVQSTSGPTWTSGSAVPSSTQPVGSLYSRTGGAVGATLYVSRGGGTWNAVAGV